MRNSHLPPHKSEFNYFAILQYNLIPLSTLCAITGDPTVLSMPHTYYGTDATEEGTASGGDTAAEVLEVLEVLEMDEEEAVVLRVAGPELLAVSLNSILRARSSAEAFSASLFRFLRKVSLHLVSMLSSVRISASALLRLLCRMRCRRAATPILRFMSPIYIE